MLMKQDQNTKKIALEIVSTENEMKELIELSTTIKFFKNILQIIQTS